jgi:hypothetical protein
VDVRLVREAGIQPLCPLGRPGSLTRTHVLPPLFAKRGKGGSNVRERPTRGDGLDPAETRAGPGSGDVTVHEYDERLASRPRGGGLRRSDEDGAGDGRGERHRQPRGPPAEAGGPRSGMAHPVKCDGPRRGRSNCAAQPR